LRSVRALACAAACVVASLAPACGDADRCDGAPADAIYANVVDAVTGEPIEAVITATEIESGESVPAECIARADETAPCTRWAIGYMRAGMFEVRAEAEDHLASTTIVDVAWASCGPESVELGLALEPAPL